MSTNPCARCGEHNGTMHTCGTGSQWDEFDRAAFEHQYEAMGFDMTRTHQAHTISPEPWAEYTADATGYAWSGWCAGVEHERRKAAL